MKILLKKMAHLAGFDHAVSWTVAGRGWSILAGPIGLWLIGTRLEPDQQGLYYLFANVVALKVFFELGLSYVIMQVVSHETTTITWDAGVPQGAPAALGRIGHILRACVRYYIIAACLLAALLAAGGLFFIHSKSGRPFSEWGIPWLMLAGIQSVALITTPFFATLQGLGQMGSVAWSRLVESFLATILTWGILVAGGMLYAVPLAAGVGLIWNASWLIFRRGPALRSLWHDAGQAISWRKDIWPFQWRIGISWAFGYFIFEAFVPMVMAYRGAAEAGRMGMSLAVTTALMGTASAWVNTKAPRMGALVAAKNCGGLDQIFCMAIWRGGLVLMAGCCAALAGLLALRHWNIPLGNRMLPPVEMAMLCGVAVSNYTTSAIAVYLRSFKREPFLYLSVANGVLVLAALLIGIPAWGTLGACTGYLTIQLLVVMPWALLLFMKQRKKNK